MVYFLKTCILQTFPWKKQYRDNSLDCKKIWMKNNIMRFLLKFQKYSARMNVYRWNHVYTRPCLMSQASFYEEPLENFLRKVDFKRYKDTRPLGSKWVVMGIIFTRVKAESGLT